MEKRLRDDVPIDLTICSRRFILSVYRSLALRQKKTPAYRIGRRGRKSLMKLIILRKDLSTRKCRDRAGAF
jgi:hypothetical protein